MKTEVAFHREKRKNPLADVVRFLKEMGMTEAEIAEELRKYQEGQEKQEQERVRE